MGSRLAAGDVPPWLVTLRNHRRHDGVPEVELVPRNKRTPKWVDELLEIVRKATADTSTEAKRRLDSNA